MKVVTLSTSFPRNADDHAGRFVLDLSRGLVERGHETTHVVPGTRRAAAASSAADRRVRHARCAPFVALDELVYGHGIAENVRRRPWLALGAPFLFRSLRRAALEAVDETAADVLLSHWLLPSGRIAAAIARERRLPHLAVEHGGGLRLLSRVPGGRRILRSILSGTNHLVFVSQDLATRATALLGGTLPIEYSICPMGVDVDAFRAPIDRAAVRGAFDPRFIILAVGRAVPLKGFDLLIDAAAGTPEVALWIVGEGPSRRDWEERARRRGVDAAFFGHLGQCALAPLYAAADLLCVPSRADAAGRSEGAPVVVQEAFAAGRAVLAARVGGLPERVADGVDGLLFPAGDSRGLAAAIRRLIDDVGYRKRLEDGARRAGEAASYRRVAAHFDGVLQTLASRPRR